LGQLPRLLLAKFLDRKSPLRVVTFQKVPRNEIRTWTPARRDIGSLPLFSLETCGRVHCAHTPGRRAGGRRARARGRAIVDRAGGAGSAPPTSRAPRRRPGARPPAWAPQTIADKACRRPAPARDRLRARARSRARACVSGEAGLAVAPAGPRHARSSRRGGIARGLAGLMCRVLGCAGRGLECDAQHGDRGLARVGQGGRCVPTVPPSPFARGPRLLPLSCLSAPAAGLGCALTPPAHHARSRAPSPGLHTRPAAAGPSCAADPNYCADQNLPEPSTFDVSDRLALPP